ncbi:MAG: LmeA family phospholipid-binding protein [Thermomicrobiales bacterium]
MRGCLIFLTAIVLGAVVALGGVYYFITRPAPTRIAETTVPVSAAAAGSFDTKINQILNAPANTDVTVELTDEELTSKFAQTVREQRAAIGADIQNPQVAVHDGLVFAGGKAKSDSFPVRVDLVVVAVPTAENGKLILRVERVESGRFPLPGRITDQIVSSVQNDALINDNLPIYVDRVEVLNGKLRLTGRPK